MEAEIPVVGPAGDTVPAAPALEGWQVSIRREIGALGRSADVRFVDSSDPRYAFVPAARLLEPTYLRDLILLAGGLENAKAEAISEIDLTIAVSRFARQYCGAVSSAALVGLAHGIGIDMSPQHCLVALTNTNLPATRRRFVVAVDLTDSDLPRCAARATSQPVTGPMLATLDELRRYVWSRLFGVHYDRLFRVVRAVAPYVSPTLLWTSAAEYVGGLLDDAQERLTATDVAPYLADCQALLEGETLPGVDGPNPLRGLLVWAPVGAGTAVARLLCCLNYLLPERDGMLCENCPYLPPEDRAALSKERRDLPIGAAGGPAHQRALQVGRSRPSFRRRHRPANLTSAAVTGEPASDGDAAR